METHRLTTVLAERAKEGSRPGARSDGHRVVLAIEGGGMRGTVSAGMASAVQDGRRRRPGWPFREGPTSQTLGPDECHHQEQEWG